MQRVLKKPVDRRKKNRWRQTSYHMLTRVIKKGNVDKDRVGWVEYFFIKIENLILNVCGVGPLLMMALTGEPVWGLNDPFGGLAHPDTFLSSLQP